MKKMIVKNLVAVIIIVMILSLMLNYIIQYKACQESMIGDSKALFGQVGRVLQQNKAALEHAKAEHGLDSDHVLELTEKNELSYIFSLLLANEGVNLYAADINTGEILGATNSDMVGKNMAEIGLQAALNGKDTNRFEATVNGVKSYCYFQKSDEVLLGRSCSNTYMYEDINHTLFSLTILISLVGALLVVLVTRYLNQNIVQAIADVNTKLKEITEGNLDTKVEVNSTPEFTELSGRINEMVKSILATTDKMSAVLENADLSIGVYEYGAGMSRVRATKQVADILDIPKERVEGMYANYIVFADYLDVIRNNPFDKERQIYAVPGEHEKYAKIETFEQGNSVFGMVTDVTENIVEQLKLEQERDVDILTGLHSRRAIYAMLDKMFEEPEELGYSAIVLADADDLKKVNDLYGHEAGDKYLCGVADCLRAVCPGQTEVARLGGDEFVLFIHNCAREELIEQGLGVLDALRGKRTIEVGSIEVPIQYSFGCAYCPSEGMDYHELLKMADKRMYEEKRLRKQKN